MSAADVVADAARMLDRVLPDWYDRIDVDALNMADGCMCVLGQAFAPAKSRMRGFDVARSIHVVFGRGSGQVSWAFYPVPGVREAWVDEIEARS